MPMCNCRGGPDCCMRRPYNPFYPYWRPDDSRCFVYPWKTWVSNKSEPLIKWPEKRVLAIWIEEV